MCLKHIYCREHVIALKNASFCQTGLADISSPPPVPLKGLPGSILCCLRGESQHVSLPTVLAGKKISGGLGQILREMGCLRESLSQSPHFQTGSHSVVPSGLDFMTGFPLQLPECWDYSVPQPLNLRRSLYSIGES